MRFARDGVVGAAALQVHDAQRGHVVRCERIRSLCQCIGQCLERVHQVLVDLLPGMSAGQPLDTQLDAGQAIWNRLPGAGDAQEDPRSAGAADDHLVLVLGVEVEQHPTGDVPRVDPGGAPEVLLLVHGQQQLQWRAGCHDLLGCGSRRVRRDRERDGDADAVVSAECRSPGSDPPIGDLREHAVDGRVGTNARIGLAHHVEMRLEDDLGRALGTR